MRVFLIHQVHKPMMRIDFGGVRFLVDPMLGEQGAYPLVVTCSFGQRLSLLAGKP